MLIAGIHVFAAFLFGMMPTGNYIFVDLLFLFNQKGGIGLVKDRMK